MIKFRTYALHKLAIMCVMIGRQHKSVGSEDEPLGSEDEPLGSEDEPLGSEHKSVALA